MTLDFILCQLFLTLDHIGPGHFSCPCISNSNHSNISHTLQSSDMVLQLSRGNLQPLNLDQLFLPVHQKHHSILIVIANVPSVTPSIYQSRGSSFLVFEVAWHHLRPLETKFSSLSYPKLF